MMGIVDTDPSCLQNIGNFAKHIEMQCVTAGKMDDVTLHPAHAHIYRLPKGIELSWMGTFSFAFTEQIITMIH
jgi:hypothetical protein